MRLSEWMYNSIELESKGRLNELAKWAWFAREFRSGLERLNPNLLKSFGVSPDAISSLRCSLRLRPIISRLISLA